MASRAWRAEHGELDIIVFEKQLMVNKTWILHYPATILAKHELSVTKIPINYASQKIHDLQ
jgi:hypothetical protein